MERARERARVSISDWTEERGRSLTSRQVEERDKEERVRVLEDDDDEAEAARALREDNMTESGFRDFLKGSVSVSVSESDDGSGFLLRFFLSAISREKREMEVR